MPWGGPDRQRDQMYFLSFTAHVQLDSMTRVTTDYITYVGNMFPNGLRADGNEAIITNIHCHLPPINLLSILYVCVCPRSIQSFPLPLLHNHVIP